MPKLNKMPVSERALMKRINRKLATEGEKFCRSRRPDAGLGDYYTIHLHTGNVVAYHQEPEKLGREMGVLAAWETVAAEEPTQEPIDMVAMRRESAAYTRAKSLALRQPITGQQAPEDLVWESHPLVGRYSRPA